MTTERGFVLVDKEKDNGRDKEKKLEDIQLAIDKLKSDISYIKFQNGIKEADRKQKLNTLAIYEHHTQILTERENELDKELADWQKEKARVIEEISKMQLKYREKLEKTKSELDEAHKWLAFYTEDERNEVLIQNELNDALEQKKLQDALVQNQLQDAIANLIGDESPPQYEIPENIEMEPSELILNFPNGTAFCKCHPGKKKGRNNKQRTQLLLRRKKYLAMTDAEKKHYCDFCCRPFQI